MVARVVVAALAEAADEDGALVRAFEVLLPVARDHVAEDAEVPGDGADDRLMGRRHQDERPALGVLLP
jgi:hypothetical protein